MFGDSLARIAAALSGEDDTWDDPAGRCAEVLADMQRDYEGKLAKWERDAPKREAAARAMQAAHDRRRAELGAGGGNRIAVYAALDWMKPQPPGGTF